MTIETKADVDDILGAIFWETKCQLAFITDKEAGLEEVDNYGTEFRLISVIPTCLDDQFWEASGWKERKQIWRKKREADIRLRMDYDRFVRETPENQRLMFRGNELIADILKALNITQDQLDQLNNS